MGFVAQEAIHSEGHYNKSSIKVESTKLDAALEYAEKGYHVFPLRPNTKIPMYPKGFYIATTDKDSIMEWWSKTPEANIGIRTGAETGLVVLDIDKKKGQNGDESLQAICKQRGEGFPCTLTSFTPSGGYHLYFKHPGRPIKNSVSKIGNGLDVRGDGAYIVAPPSEIDSYAYRWKDGVQEVADMPGWVEHKAHDLAESLVEVGVPEGQRNDYIFKLACSLRGKETPYEDAEQQVLNAAQNCTPPLPQHEALRCLESAYSYPAGAIFCKEILEMNMKHSVVMVRGKCRVMNQVVDPLSGSSDINFSTIADFRARYSNKKIQVGSASYKLADYWLQHPSRKEYEGITFSPGKDVPGFFNLWQGFAVKPARGDCSLFLEHIRDNISSGNNEIYNYVIGWMADAVQNPSHLLGTSLVLRGKQGTGKGVFCNQLGALFGRHYVHLNNSKHLTGNFNSHLAEAVFVFADEAFWAGDKSSEGSLKALITEPTLMMEKKGYDAVNVKNHVHLIVASNNDWVVPADFDNRRFVLLDISDKHQQDHEYFKAITQQMNNGGREALLDFLLNFDLQGINLRQLPRTKALFETKLLSMSPFEKFWHSKLQNGSLDVTKDDWQDGLVLTTTLYNDYLQFVKGIGGRHRLSDAEFGKQLNKLIPDMRKIRVSQGGSRPYSYLFPTLQECRSYFNELTRTEIEWDSGDENVVEYITTKQLRYESTEISW